MNFLWSHGQLDTSAEMSKLADYLQTAKTAAYLGVHHNTLRKWAASGELPMHRNPANGYRLFKRSDIDAFLKKTARPIKVTK